MKAEVEITWKHSWWVISVVDPGMRDRNRGNAMFVTIATPQQDGPAQNVVVWDFLHD